MSHYKTIDFHGIKVSLEEGLYEHFNWVAQDGDKEIWIFEAEPIYEKTVDAFYEVSKDSEFLGYFDFPENIAPHERILNFKES